MDNDFLSHLVFFSLVASSILLSIYWILSPWRRWLRETSVPLWTHIKAFHGLEKENEFRAATRQLLWNRAGNLDLSLVLPINTSFSPTLDRVETLLGDLPMLISQRRLRKLMMLETSAVEVIFVDVSGNEKTFSKFASAFPSNPSVPYSEGNSEGIRVEVKTFLTKKCPVGTALGLGAFCSVGRNIVIATNDWSRDELDNERIGILMGLLYGVDSSFGGTSILIDRLGVNCHYLTLKRLPAKVILSQIHLGRASSIIPEALILAKLFNFITLELDGPARGPHRRIHFLERLHEILATWKDVWVARMLYAFKVWSPPFIGHLTFDADDSSDDGV